MGQRSFPGETRGRRNEGRPGRPSQTPPGTPAGPALCPLAWGTPARLAAGQRGHSRESWGRGGGGAARRPPAPPDPPSEGLPGEGPRFGPSVPAASAIHSLAKDASGEFGGRARGRAGVTTLSGLGREGPGRGPDAAVDDAPRAGALTAAASARMRGPRPGAQPQPADPLPPSVDAPAAASL